MMSESFSTRIGGTAALRRCGRRRFLRFWRSVRFRRGLCVEFSLAVAVGLSAEARAQERPPTMESQRCLNCHGQERIATATEQERASMVSTPPTEPRSETSGLYFDQQRFGSSVHAGLDCGDCHSGTSRLPHPASLPDPRCGSCHPAQADRYSRGVHAREPGEGQTRTPRAWRKPDRP